MNTQFFPARQLLDEAARFGPVIDALTAHVALLDGAGTIIHVNRQWKAFAQANGGESPTNCVGDNYLELLDRVGRCEPHDAKGREDSAFATQVAAGLRQVLEGISEKFQLEYPCDSPTARRWFLLTVTRFPGDGGLRAVVAHEDVTPLKAAEEKTRAQGARLLESFSTMVHAISIFIEKRDPYTAGHQHQVADLCEAIAGSLGMDGNRRYGLRLGAIIHDIGKVMVPAEILARPGRLMPAEHELIRCHPEAGFDILRGIDFPWPIAEMVYQHHERLDGTGYPRKLRGDEICFEARIIAVADVYDAITSHRPYRPAKGREEGIAALVQGRGTHYDAAVVDGLLAHLGTLP